MPKKRLGVPSSPRQKEKLDCSRTTIRYQPCSCRACELQLFFDMNKLSITKYILNIKGPNAAIVPTPMLIIRQQLGPNLQLQTRRAPF